MFPYDRNVRISRPEISSKSDVTLARKSVRIGKHVRRFNLADVVCSVCQKKIRADIPAEHYVGGIVCSVECLKRADQ